MKFSRKGIAVLAAALSIMANLSAQASSSNYTEKDLVWKEDFNGKKLNAKNWNFEFHEPGWVNNELQSYDDSPKNTYLKDGCLVIQPMKIENKDGSVSYTSGRVNTQGKQTFTYGRIEARLKVPKGQGYLPAFWMMPDDESFYGQWPKCGEIDIMEVLGNEIDTLYGTIHYGEPHNQKQGTYKLDSDTFADSFHDFAIEWEPGVIRYYCDGVNYATFNDWYTKRPGFDEVTFPAPFDQPFYIIFNVAVGGNWPGNPDSTTTFGPEAQMVVDWVKVYQKKEYNEDVDKVQVVAAKAEVDGSGNMVKPGAENWAFLKFQGGNGSLSVKNDKLDIIPTSDGPVLHAVQVVQQNVSLTKGSIYRYSFDASADEERTIVACISAPNNGWIRYLPDATVKLTPNKQHYSYEFKMLEFTDPTARIEFNCGNQKSLAPVHISNIRLEKIGEVDLSAAGLNLLPDGNMIHNGQFQEGKGRLAHWKIDNKINAEIKVSNDKGRRELMVTVPEGITSFSDVILSQEGFALPKGKQYLISFDAYASKKARMGFQFGKMKEYPELTTKKQHFEYLYTVPKTNEYSFAMMLSNSGTTVYVDNVLLKENTKLLNGSFAAGMAAWELYAHENSKCQIDISGEGAEKEAILSIDKTGNMDWMIQLKQNKILLEKGKKYHVSLNVKSDLDRTIMWALQRDGSKDDNWIPYSDTKKIQVSKDYQTYEHTFTMSSETDDNVIFTISMGAVDGKEINKSHKVYIDDITLEEVAD
ncbi:MAG: carbohydrate binding domain-containing protein [Treponema sp.]|nr:carbohydrate binding domain-containing protein [Treponema sp.]